VNDIDDDAAGARHFRATPQLVHSSLLPRNVEPSCSVAGGGLDGLVPGVTIRLRGCGDIPAFVVTRTCYVAAGCDVW